MNYKKEKREKKQKRKNKKYYIYIYLGKSTYPQVKILSNLSHNL